MGLTFFITVCVSRSLDFDVKWASSQKTTLLATTLTEQIINL